MRRAYCYVALVLIGWSVGPVGGKALLRGGDGGPQPHPLQVAFWAISAGWVLLFALLAARGRLSRLGDFSARGWLVLVAMGCFGWAGYAGSLNFALSRLPLPDAVVINYLHPVFTVLFQGAVFGSLVRPLSGWEQAADAVRRPSPARLALGILLCLAGVAVVASRGDLSHLGALRSAMGAGAALFAAFAWGVYSNLGRFVAVKPGRPATGLADVQTFAAMSFGLVLLGAALAATGRLSSPEGFHASLYLARWGPAEVTAWTIVAAMGLFLYFGGFTLWLAALELGRAAGEAHRLPPLTYLTPVLTVTNGWLFLHEPFGAGFWQGAALIALGNLAIVLRR